MEGWLKAVDAKTGQVLWQFKTPSGIIGNPMTYTGPDKKQYVAVLSGIGGWAGIGVAAGIGAEDPTAGLSALPVVDAWKTIHALRVCGDPDNMPFSDSLRQGFEDKIADVIANALGD